MMTLIKIIIGSFISVGILLMAIGLQNLLTNKEPQLIRKDQLWFETKVYKISIEEDECEIYFTENGSHKFHSLEYDTCPDVKIGDKVKIILEVTK